MAIPPFPPQDLAKLVLGYLAEEELMTAYDEFLQASPYLDAFRNEYDRIFMTSLRSILADYRAVKIHVETCKPHLLRKRLLQCTNLFEIVKFLISFIDHHKLYAEEHIEKSSFQKSSVQKGNICEICNPLNLKNCVCKSKISTTLNAETTNEEHSIFSTSIEATPLEDLPGNSKSKTKPELGVRKSILLSIDQKDCQDQKQDNNTLSSTSVVQVSYDLTSVSHNTLAVNQIPQMTKASCMDSKHKIEEFNNILNLVCNKSVSNEKLYDNIISNRISNEENFQDFANGVYGSSQEEVTRVPDSSTTDMLPNIAPETTKETLISSIKGPPKETVCQPIINLTSPTISLDKCIPGDRPQMNTSNKVTGKKIKILSDVKIDKHSPCNAMPSILKGNVTSTPSLSTHSLVINGTPAFRQKTPVVSCNYSKDEIMAMPTLIIVPTSGPYNIITRPVYSNNLNNNSSSNKIVPTSEAIALSPKRRPLFVEVPDDVSIRNDQKPKANDVGLVKTVDVVAHASLPKDNTVPNKSSTPQVLPPLRKSSSTPRRSSHIRVLDFTTPRRILNEAIPEKETSDDSVVVLSDSPVHSVRDTVNVAVPISNIPSKINNTEINREQKVIKRRNWDEELRALVASNENLLPAYVPKSSKKKKKIGNKSISENNTNHEGKSESTKTKKSRKKTKSAENVEDPKSNDKKIEKKIKPTINIISAPEHTSIIEHEKVDKPIDTESQIDTPENERLSLQNVIGAKLNISDLLETPYKQAIYDIQMETPRFLGPDLPDEPVSDIKIMNIPTPRFFDTPKPTQATPSSYSSRPTDYSSGGSYYKPDDQDYVPIPEVAECKITETKSKGKLSKPSENQKVCPKDSDVKSAKSRRPVRKCTKNVSYYNSSNVNTSTKPNDVSVAEEKKTVKSNVSQEKNGTKSKSVKSKITKINSEKHKSPFKKDTPKNFMKIKPRRVTPIKNSKNRKNTPDLSLSSRKIINLKEKNPNTSDSTGGAPTKSRRKSSTPRKLHCNKSYHSSTSSNTSPDMPTEKKSEKDVKICVTHDSDSEQQPLRWSDDGSQDVKHKGTKESSVTEDEDIITKIQEYIETIDCNKSTSINKSIQPIGSLQNDLVKRGFDVETAKIIERDLLDTPPIQDGVVQSTSNDTVDANINEKEGVKESDKVESSVSETMQKTEIVKEQEEKDDSEENDDIDFDVKETNENTDNYFTYNFDETKHKVNTEIVKLKDKFSMEVCIDDGVSIRLRATQFSVLLDQEPVEIKDIDGKELESAISSISNIERLYTPIKDPRDRCYEIFDSTLTSLDTPLKPASPKCGDYETSVTEIVLEVENISTKAEGKKRKRVQSGASDEGSNANKRTKSEQYLINPASIQNIDIESVLSKLHGP